MVIDTIFSILVLYRMIVLFFTHILKNAQYYHTPIICKFSPKEERHTRINKIENGEFHWKIQKNIYREP